MERYPNLKEEVGGSIPALKSPLYLTKTWRWYVGLLSQKEKEKRLQGKLPIILEESMEYISTSQGRTGMGTDQLDLGTLGFRPNR